MTRIPCPDCGGQLHCVDSLGVWWRCYGHGERTYDMSGNPAAQRETAGLRALSAGNAAAMVAGKGAR